MSFCNKTNDTLIVDTVNELLNRAHHEVLFTNILKADISTKMCFTVNGSPQVSQSGTSSIESK